MSSPFSRSLRALESDRSRGWRTAAVGALLLIGWVSWFLLARVPLYQTSTLARLEATAAAHPVDARMLGRVVSVILPSAERCALETCSSSSKPTASGWRSPKRGGGWRRSGRKSPPSARKSSPRRKRSRRTDARASRPATSSVRRCAKRKRCWGLPTRRRASSRGCAPTASSPRNRELESTRRRRPAEGRVGCGRRRDRPHRQRPEHARKRPARTHSAAARHALPARRRPRHGARGGHAIRVRGRTPRPPRPD